MYMYVVREAGERKPHLAPLRRGLAGAMITTNNNNTTTNNNNNNNITS